MVIVTVAGLSAISAPPRFIVAMPSGHQAHPLEHPSTPYYPDSIEHTFYMEERVRPDELQHLREIRQLTQAIGEITEQQIVAAEQRTDERTDEKIELHREQDHGIPRVPRRTEPPKLRLPKLDQIDTLPFQDVCMTAEQWRRAFELQADGAATEEIALALDLPAYVIDRDMKRYEQRHGRLVEGLLRHEDDDDE